MAKPSLKDLKAQLKKEKEEANKQSSGSKGGFWYPVWDLPDNGKTSVRILTDPAWPDENEFIYYINYLEHKIQIDGKWEKIPCPKTWGQHHDCPICELSRKMYAAKNEELGKYYYRKKFMILRGLVTSDGLVYESEDDEPATGQVKPFRLSAQIWKQLKGDADEFIMESDDDDEPFFDLDGGRDFVFKKEDGPKWPSYTSSGFAMKAKKIPAALQKQIEGMDLEPLYTLLPKQLSFDEVQAKLEAHTNVVGDDVDDDVEVASDDEIEALINRNRGSADDDDVPVDDEVVEDDDDNGLGSLLDDDDDDDDDLDALAKLAAD